MGEKGRSGGAAAIDVGPADLGKGVAGTARRGGRRTLLPRITRSRMDRPPHDRPFSPMRSLKAADLPPCVYGREGDGGYEGRAAHAMRTRRVVTSPSLRRLVLCGIG